MTKKQLIESKVRKIVKEVLNEESAKQSPINVKAIAKYTDNNDHTEAVLELARGLKLPKYIKAVQCVEGLHTFYGQMPSNLSQIREELKNNLLGFVKQEYGEEEMKRVKAAF